MREQIIKIDYTNWQGKRSHRFVKPLGIVFKSTMYHPDPQWLMAVFDMEKNAVREFAFGSIHNITAPTSEELDRLYNPVISRGESGLAGSLTREYNPHVLETSVC